MEIGLMIFLGIFALAIGVPLILKLIAWSKGKIEIRMNRYEYSPGDSIEGQVALILKKPVHSKLLKVGLLGERKVIEKVNGRNRAKVEPVYEFYTPLEGEKDYAPGESVCNFKINIPKDAIQTKVTLGNSVLTTSLSFLGSVVKSPINWYVKTELEIAGKNLSQKVRVNIV